MKDYDVPGGVAEFPPNNWDTREVIARALVHYDFNVDLFPSMWPTADTRPGVCFPRLERIEYPNKFGGVAHWNVVVILPQDDAESQEFMGRLVAPMLDALHPILAITSMTPVRLQLDGIGTLPAAFFNGHREAD